VLIFIFLSSGLFLGWSLGANDAANIFGTAVESKMLRFKTAAIIGGLFVILGAFFSGEGASHTLGKLGSINEIAGSFVVALAAAVTVYGMTKLKLPVSTSQAIVGAIVGWNFFARTLTDYNSLIKILITWLVSPLLAAFFSIILYLLVKFIFNNVKVHLLNLDFFIRVIFIVSGAFGAYSLGANNIANVMGVFIPVSPFKHFSYGQINLSSIDQLFLIGGVSIAVGIFTYSKNVMKTVGGNIVNLNPKAAIVVVLSSALVLFLFASQSLQAWLILHHLPTIPLVPVSSSQVVVGAVLGIGFLKGIRGINFKLLGKISSGWITTPLIAGVISFVSLFVAQNVFQQQVVKSMSFSIDSAVVKVLEEKKVSFKTLINLKGKIFKSEVDLDDILRENIPGMSKEQRLTVVAVSKIVNIEINSKKIESDFPKGWFTKKQLDAIKTLNQKKYRYKWQLKKVLVDFFPAWKFKPKSKINKKYNNDLQNKIDYLCRHFSKVYNN